MTRGVTRGHNYPGVESLRGARECPSNVWKHFLQYSTFASERTLVRTWGRQTCFLPGRHLPSVCPWARAGLKGRRARCQFSLEGPYGVFHDAIVCKIFVFADSQRSRLLLPVVDYVPAVLTWLLAAFDCKPHEMVLKINESCPWLQTALEHRFPKLLRCIRDVRVLLCFPSVLPLRSVSSTSDCRLLQHQITSDFSITVLNFI